MARAQHATAYRVQSAIKRRRWFSSLNHVKQRSGADPGQLEQLAQRPRNPTLDPRTLLVRHRWF
jgi:hypothetical protein